MKIKVIFKKDPPKVELVFLNTRQPLSHMNVFIMIGFLLSLTGMSLHPIKKK